MSRPRSLTPFLVAALVLLCAACDRTITVKPLNPQGVDKLELRGTGNVEGTLTRPVHVVQDKRTLPVGTRVLVRQTWIMRRGKGAKPPGYRINGYYDSTKRTDGFVLPPGRADIFFVSGLLPEGVGYFPIPIEAFKLDKP